MMSRHVPVLAGLVALTLHLAAHAEEPPPVTLIGQSITTALPINPDFHGLSITGFGEVRVTQGAELALTVTTDIGYLSRVHAEVTDRVLNLGNIYAEDGLRPNLVYELTVPDLDRIRASGGSSVHVNSLVTDTLSIDVSGSGAVSIFVLSSDSLDVTGSGEGSVVLTGPYRVEHETTTLSGGARFHLESD